MRSLRDQLSDYLAPMRRKISLMLGRAVIKLVNDARAVQTNQLSILKDEVRDDVERFQEYGFTSVPLPGCEAMVGFFGGDRNHGIVFATEDRRYRLKGLEGGEVALYTDEGDKIHFKRGNIIEIQTKTLIVNAETEVQVLSPSVQVECDTAQITAGESVSVDAPEILATCETLTVDAATKVEMTAPQIEMTAAASMTITTPALVVTGTIQALGVGAGSVPVAGEVADATGTKISQIKTAFNAHVHGASTTPTPTIP